MFPTSKVPEVWRTYLYPTYDEQELIYHDMMDQLKASIEILKTADPAMGYVGADPVYDNNLD